MLTREGGWVVCEMSTKVNKRWVHGSFMVNVDFQRIASSLFTWLKLKKFSSNDSNVISSKAQVSWFKKPLFRENFYTCFSMQSGSQSETDAALLVASPSWASRIWPCVEHLTQSCFLKVLSFLAHKSRALEVTFFWSFPLCVFSVTFSLTLPYRSYYSGGSEVDKYKICKSIVKWMWKK